jgi:hypothetical protein
MPYIKPHTRAELKKITYDPQNAGELNYELTSICDEYIRSNGVCYQTFNDIIGALEGAKLEIYRRLVEGYEDQKIKENGDVYHPDTVRKCNG